MGIEIKVPELPESVADAVVVKTPIAAIKPAQNPLSNDICKIVNSTGPTNSIIAKPTKKPSINDMG